MSSGFATEKYVLHRVKHLEGYTIGALDGVIGHVKDFYFDDESWVIQSGIPQHTAGVAHDHVPEPLTRRDA
jgi:hypothetical protein